MRWFGLALVIIGLGLIALVAVAHSQNATTTTISKDTTVSWEIAALLLGLVATVSGSFTLLRAHGKDASIHLTTKALDETYRRKDVCDSILHEMTGRLDIIVSDVKEIKRAVMEGRE